MRHQLKLFEEADHLEPDYFISGDPLVPDIGEIDYTYWNDFVPALGRPAVRRLVLCDPVEDGWKWA